MEGRPGRHPLVAGRRGRHPLQPGLLRGPRGPRPRPARRALAADLGLRDELGLLRPVHQGPGPAAAAQAQAPQLGGGRLLRAHVLHRLPHAAQPRPAPGRPEGAHLGRRRRPGRVRHAAVRRRGRRERRRRLQRREGRARRAARRQGLHRPQRVQGHDAPRRRDAGGGEGALRASPARSPSASARSSAIAPDVVFEHVGKATFPTSVYTVKPFGKVVICGATSGYTLDFDVRYLWMRQKEIIGSHFANAWECNAGEQAHRGEQGAPRALAYDGLRPGRGGTSVDAREQALRQDRRPRRRHRGGPGQDRRGPRAPSAPRSAPDGRRRAHPVVRDGLPRRHARGRAGRHRPRRAALRRALLRRAPLARRPLQVHPDGRVRGQARLGALLERPGDDRVPGADLGLVPGARALRLERPGHRRRAERARRRQRRARRRRRPTRPRPRPRSDLEGRLLGHPREARRRCPPAAAGRVAYAGWIRSQRVP